jgi:RNA polymerase sigma factor (sigma-70 family)
MTDILGDYLRTISRVPLLTDQEELHLGRLVRCWLDDPEPSPQVQRKGKRALNRVVNANLRLVVSVVTKSRRRIRHLAVEPIDLIQAGNLGLIRAAEKFDPSRGYRFSTYAYWWIRQAVSRHVQEHGALIRVPYPLANLAGKLEALKESGRRSVTCEEASQLLGEHPRRIAQAMALQRFNAAVSLDQTLGSGDSGDMTLLDTVSDGVLPEVEDDYNWFYGQLSQLSPLEFEVLNQRFAEQERRSLMQVAQRLGKSKHQIQAIERRALTKLRTALTPVLNP